MSERVAEHREARFGEPIEVGERTLIPLVEVQGHLRVEGGRSRGGGWVRPLGVLVEGPEGTRAFGLGGEDLPILERARSPTSELASSVR